MVLVAERLVALLESTRAEPMPFQVLTPGLAEMIKDPHVRPYLRLWLELVAFAAGGEEYYSAIAKNRYAMLS